MRIGLSYLGSMLDSVVWMDLGGYGKSSASHSDLAQVFLRISSSIGSGSVDLHGQGLCG